MKTTQKAPTNLYDRLGPIGTTVLAAKGVRVPTIAPAVLGASLCLLMGSESSALTPYVIGGGCAVSLAGFLYGRNRFSSVLAQSDSVDQAAINHCLEKDRSVTYLAFRPGFRRIRKDLLQRLNGADYIAKE